jgi:hypothetical protein
MSLMEIYGILASNSGYYEEYGIRGYNAMVVR